jgi:NAD(P)-dependent dehydrogenase (short-subunit alcohol dehydrogenase family)
MSSLKGKTALVTGAASGIGRATAHALSKAGCKLILCDVNVQGLREVERDIARHGELLLARRVDVASRAEMRAFADEVHSQIEAVDILVNNAGVGLSGGILDTSLEDWDWILGVNLWGVIHGCHFFVPKMVERKAGGHVVNVSSVLGFFATPDVLGYATAKFGVFGFSEALRGELQPHDIGVSTICPGMIATNIIHTGRFRSGPKSEDLKAKVARTFEKRGHPPETVAKAVVRAIETNRAVMPAAPEAWAFWYAKRLFPQRFAKVANWISRRVAD